jgi:choline dehydrogenase-like flavoprotein
MSAGHSPRTGAGRAPDVFERGGWVAMREYGDDEAVDFAVVGAGAGGATLACKLAEAGFSVVVLEAGPFWRPLEDFASDEEAPSSSCTGRTSACPAAPMRWPSAATTRAGAWADRPSTSA